MTRRKKPIRHSAIVTVSLPPRHLAILEDLAKNEGVTRSEIIRRLLSDAAATN